jgi:hypothetical protein
MKPLSKKQLITLNIAAKQAYDYQLRNGGIDFETADQWRHAQVMECVGMPGLRACHNGHYRALVNHFARMAGKIVSYDAQILAGKPTRASAPEDTYQNRQIEATLILESIMDHADRMRKKGRTDIITAAYVEKIAAAKFKTTHGELRHLTVEQLSQLLFTVRNRINAREGKGDSDNRNKKQRRKKTLTTAH